ENRDTGGERGFFYRRERHLLAAAARPVGLRDHGNDFQVRVGKQVSQARDGERRCAAEQQTKGGLCHSALRKIEKRLEQPPDRENHYPGHVKEKSRRMLEGRPEIDREQRDSGRDRQGGWAKEPGRNRPPFWRKHQDGYHSPCFLSF